MTDPLARDWTVPTAGDARAAEDYAEAARLAANVMVAPEGKVDSRALEREQQLVHGFAWIGKTAAALSGAADWAKRSRDPNRFGPVEELMMRLGFGEYALEYEASRFLCDARILNIFEGASEIQAQVIGRGLIGDR